MDVSRPSAEYWATVREVVERTNQERAAHGLPPLKLNERLCEAAQWMATDLAQNGYIGHMDSEGRRLAHRIPAFEYSRPYWLGENIAAGQRTPERVIQAWTASPDHRKNMLHSAYREIGVGYALDADSRYGIYWAQELGSRIDYYPVVINLEAFSTNSSEVDLYLYGEGWAKQMRFSHDGRQWTDWERFRSRRKWQLLPGSGLRAVYVQLRNGSRLLEAHDEIVVDPL
jgi:hypothetical protein